MTKAGGWREQETSRPTLLQAASLGHPSPAPPGKHDAGRCDGTLGIGTSGQSHLARKHKGPGRSPSASMKRELTAMLDKPCIVDAPVHAWTACHHAIREQTGKLVAEGGNSDELNHERFAACRSNHLPPGMILNRPLFPPMR